MTEKLTEKEPMGLTPMRELAEQSARYGTHWSARRINRSYLWGALVLASPVLVYFIPSTPRPHAIPAAREITEKIPGPDTVMHVVVVAPDRTQP